MFPNIHGLTLSISLPKNGKDYHNKCFKYYGYEGRSNCADEKVLFIYAGIQLY